MFTNHLITGRVRHSVREGKSQRDSGLKAQGCEARLPRRSFSAKAGATLVTIVVLASSTLKRFLLAMFKDLDLTNLENSYQL
jgi:hypothetical protein